MRCLLKLHLQNSHHSSVPCQESVRLALLCFFQSKRQLNYHSTFEYYHFHTTTISICHDIQNILLPCYSKSAFPASIQYLQDLHRLCLPAPKSSLCIRHTPYVALRFPN